MGMRSSSSRGFLTCGRGGSGKGGSSIDRGRRRRPHSRPEVVPTVCLGHARISGEGREWRGWEDFFTLEKEMK